MENFSWDGWNAEIHATLLFIVQNDKILLIEKKRGHGAGKINGPGGKIDPGETPLECVLRETNEELHVVAENPKKVAELQFAMSDYPDILCHVFIATKFTGKPTETDEAIPLWAKIDQIPYARMWEDDQLWLPRILSGETLVGKFLFELESLKAYEITPTMFEAQ